PGTSHWRTWNGRERADVAYPLVLVSAQFGQVRSSVGRREILEDSEQRSHELAITDRVERLDRIGALDTIAAPQSGERGPVRIVGRKGRKRTERDRAVGPCGAHECVTCESGALLFNAQSARDGVIAHRKRRASTRDVSRAAGDSRRGHPSQGVEGVVYGGPVLDRAHRDL